MFFFNNLIGLIAAGSSIGPLFVAPQIYARLITRSPHNCDPPVSAMCFGQDC